MEVIDALLREFKEWVSDPVIAGLLGFMVTGLFLKLASSFVRSLRKK